MATTLTAGQMPRLASDGYKEPSILESINPFKHDPTVLSNEVLQKNLIALRTEFDKASKIADDGARVKAMVDVVINAERLAHESARNMTDSNTAKVLKATTFGLIGGWSSRCGSFCCTCRRLSRSNCCGVYFVICACCWSFLGVWWYSVNSFSNDSSVYFESRLN
jgi:hypothetical protein